MHTRFLWTVFWGLVLSGLAVPASAQEPWQPMFNGKDFSGWVLTNTPAETWSYKGEVIVCSGKPIGEIRTAKMYQNFVMELEWRHLVPKGNAGVFIWADDITSRGVPFHRGIEVQVLENDYGNNESHTTHGDIFPIHGAQMTPINGRGGSRAFPTEFRSNPSPEWNHYRIEGRSGEISLAVNGKLVTRGRKCVPSQGYICLESEGGVVEYRNVRIQELPSEGIPQSQVAIADRGYQSIYNGLSLEGWLGDANHWKANDWVLSCSSPKTKTKLRSARPFENANLVVDVRLKDEESMAAISIGSEMTILLSEPAIHKFLEPNGKWNRIERIKRGDGFQLTVNGHVVADASPSSASGPVELEADGAVEFANIYVGPRDQID